LIELKKGKDQRIKAEKPESPEAGMLGNLKERKVRGYEGRSVRRRSGKKISLNLLYLSFILSLSTNNK